MINMSMYFRKMSFFIPLLLLAGGIVIGSCSRIKRCCDHEDCDIGCLCASSTHCCKCFVARGVKERDGISVERNGVCTDMLGDSACFSAGDV